MRRVYTTLVAEHLKKYRQMVFLAGPRQVGKTTCSLDFAESYSRFYHLNWENFDHRRFIVKGPQTVADHCELNRVFQEKPLIVFDEIHKSKKWKLFLKGFFDLYEKACQIIVTGSAKLNVYQRGGDSLMGRYFSYRIHPLSVHELLSTEVADTEVQSPKELEDSSFQQLFKFGGFPEPFLKASQSFSNNWQRLRKQQLVQEDIRAMEQILDLAELEYLVDILINEAGQPLNMSSIANTINVAETTIHRWIKVLESFFFCYTIKPWSKNLRYSIRKTPKVYLWDWAMINDLGQRTENFIASHLLKAVQFWTDRGLGEYDLYFLRDKSKREVDFLVTKNGSPWFLVEAKTSKNKGISKSLYYYQQKLGVPHAFQVVLDLPFEQVNCFDYSEPVIVPAKTFLSQLV